jgi:hypothetical protein
MNIAKEEVSNREKEIPRALSNNFTKKEENEH